MKTLKGLDVKNKKVLVRCDFNVPLDNKGNVLDSFRIKQTIPTIQYLIKKKAKVILMAHLGSPKGEAQESLKLTLIHKKVEELLGSSIIKANDCIGPEVEELVKEMKSGQVILLENLRFHKGEKENDDKFSKDLAKLGDIYINDAFSVSHREHASIIGITKHLPSVAGLLLEKEVKELSRIVKNPKRPLVAIIGGVKISSKIKVIKHFCKKADHLLIGGKVANTILAVKKITSEKVDLPEDIIEEVENIQLTDTNIHLPLDTVVSPDDTGKEYVRQSSLGKVKKTEDILDVGPETVEIFSRIISEAKTIVWSGPIGYFEKPLFENGTKGVAEKVVKNKEAFTVVGGGDTLFAVLKFGVRDQFDHASTGGGAMLTFISNGDLPGLKVLE
tara:strand:- start:112 stop:1275 length:1164 start_codon:yes stop_codon:yes gene_type:complete